uniref:N-acetyltransferase domain-containing protein n=1 Tax=Plectus sambesii TaxID=2011161 RepID=A0A914VVE2_9BILA
MALPFTNSPQQRLPQGNSSFLIQESTLDDWKRIVDLSADTQRWAMAYDDFPVWKKAFGEQNAELLVAKKPDGQVIGFVSIAKFGPDIAAVGNYYVHPAYRGQGIGMQLFDKVTQTSLAEGRNLSLNAAFLLSKKYADNGFDKYPDWGLRAHVVTGANGAEIATLVHNSKIVSLKAVEFDQIATYDRSVAANVDRSEWLEAWINHPTGRCKIALDTTNHVIGYGVVREVSQNRLVFGPLYANDQGTAAALIKVILEEVDDYPSREIHFLSPSTNEEMNELTAMLSRPRGTYEHRGDDGICQFTKKVLKVDVRKVYAVADVALCFI